MKQDSRRTWRKRKVKNFTKCYEKRINKILIEIRDVDRKQQ